MNGNTIEALIIIIIIIIIRAALSFIEMWDQLIRDI
jgi:hypothetical protein